jgi:GGDEF domain-containing protein
LAVWREAGHAVCLMNLMRGDEFALLLPDTGLDEAMCLAQALYAAKRAGRGQVACAPNV